MKRRTIFFKIPLLLILAISSHALQKDFPILQGPYLGQKPPGMIPLIFAPGIVSTDNGAGCYGFLNNGQMFVFERCAAGEDWKYQPIQVMEEKHGSWTRPVPETFGGLYPYNFTVGPDGQTLYFSSLRLPDGSGPRRWANIWKTERTPGGWSRPVMFEAPVNTDGPDAYPTVTKDGTLYFMSVRAGGYGQDDIYRAEMKRGEYPAVENIGPLVNTDHAEVDPFVAADESCLIFCSDRPGGYGKFDLYLSFLGPDGRWTEPVNMGQGINTSGQEFRPCLSADGRYFFFTRYEENSDTNGLYWVSSKVLDGLRQPRSKRRQEKGSK
jgi:hypothetical protein